MALQSDHGHQPDEPEESYKFQNPEHHRGLAWPELSENIFVTNQNKTQIPFKACEGSCWIVGPGLTWVMNPSQYLTSPVLLRRRSLDTGILSPEELRSMASHGYFVNVAHCML